MLKKLLASLAIVLLLFQTIGTSPASAQWYNQDPVQWYKQVYDEDNPSEIFGERYTAAQVDWILMSFFTWLPTKAIGPKATGCFLEAILNGSSEVDNCLTLIATTTTPESVNMAYSSKTKNDKSLLSTIFNDRPLSAFTMAKKSITRFSLTQNAYAQNPGFGYNALGDLTQQMWSSSRNIAYGLAILVTIVLSFMIMFRVKISPQTAISVQSALPKIIIALVLVTFSYAIAGLLIDLMYVVIGILSLMLSGMFNQNATDVFNSMTLGPEGLGFFLYLIVGIGLYPLALLIGMVSMVGGSGLAGLTLTAISYVAGVILAILLAVILIIAFLFIWFKLTLLLLKTIATILLLVVFGPIQIVIGVAANGIGFSAWVKNLAANLAVFPTVGLFFVLSRAFLNLSITIGATDVGFDVTQQILDVMGDSNFPNNYSPIPFGNGWPPLLGGAGEPTALILMGISMVLLFMAPKASDIIKGLISGRPYSYGMAIGEALGTPTTTALQMGATREGAGWDNGAKDNPKLWRQLYHGGFNVLRQTKKVR